MGSKGWNQLLIVAKKALSRVEEEETPKSMKVPLNKVSGGRKRKHKS